MTLCFIPARGGSKRIPRKNVRLLAGRPLLLYTVELARDSQCFDRVIVSSDDDELLALAEGAGVEGDPRPAHLGGDGVRFVEVLKEYLSRHPGQFQTVAVLLPTTPFRAPDDLTRAFALFERRAGDAFVVSVSRYEFPPEFACDFSAEDGRLTLRQPEVYRRSTQSQSLTPTWHPNGLIFLGSVRRFLETESFFADPVLGVEIPPERAFDLDFPHQWAVAEALMAARQTSL